ncbi:MAG: potassium-transporting ATPase subunit A [Myxococcales bacterium]|nr:potassium-transporting ATPase subunit A [Myxococcales bacterium]
MLYGLALFASCLLLSWPLARYMAWVFSPTSSGRFDSWLERLVGEGAVAPQDWRRYASSLVVFNALMFALVFLVLVFQHRLPLNPDAKPGLEPSLAFHTAISFATNTNLQHYSGEQSLSYFSQVFGLSWLQFVSAATGLGALAAIARALGPSRSVGNFYRDLLRGSLLLLLPISVGFAIVLVLLGVPMTLDGAAVAHTLEGTTQAIARGPVAGMLAIKQLGTNGGGFFGPNSTHPFENPSQLTNALSNVAILLIPMASVWMFGRLIGRLRHAAVVFGVMSLLFLATAASALHFEARPNPAASAMVDQGLGNLEGKDLRVGAGPGAFWAVSTTATSNGSVAAMHDSLSPLGGLTALVGMWLNVSFGGVGVGMINMFLYVVVAVFIAGLMVGRTPEYLGRKIETREMKVAALALLLHPLLILGGTAVFAATPWGVQSVANPGSHGFSEILYEMSSAAANNGSGFEGLGDNTLPWNVLTGAWMFLGRYLPIVLPLAIAGFLSEKKRVPETTGTLRTDTPLFGCLLLGSVLLLGGLLFLPAAVLGPIAEHLGMLGAR